MNRRERERLQHIALGMMAAIIVLLLVLGVAVLKKRARDAALLAEWSQQQVPEEVVQPPPPDPFAGLADAAVARVRDTPVQDVGGAATTIGARVAAGALTQRVDALNRSGVSPGEWHAQRLGEHSLYQVEFLHTFHGVQFGPRWYVQMNPEGPQGNTGVAGVVPVNGLAEQLHRADLDEGLRYLNRADEVLQALTEHRFEGGTRLGSALLVFFQGRGDATERSVIGWHVVPESTDPEGELLYRAYFQWQEGEETRDAWWEVNLSNRDFGAKDLQANEIMASGATVAQDDVIDIRPRTLDLTQPPESERDPRVRALRHLLANDRLVEAVGTLLSFRARNTDLEYRGWEPTVTAERHVYDVACLFDEAGEGYRVTWRVDANSGTIVPTSDIARTAQLALELAVTPEG